MIRVARLCALSLSFAAVSAADTVVLEDGTVLEGKVQWLPGDELQVDDVVVGRVRVASLSIGDPARDELDQRRDRLAPGDLPGRRELAQLALDCRLDDEAAALLLEVLALTPDPAARELLTTRLEYHEVDGRWVAPEEYFAARGLVKVGRRWIPRGQEGLVEDEGRIAEARELASLEVRRADRARASHARDLCEAEAKLTRIRIAALDPEGSVRLARARLQRDREAVELARRRTLHARDAIGAYRSGMDQRVPSGIELELQRCERRERLARDAGDLSDIRLAEVEQVQANAATAEAEAEASVVAVRDRLPAVVQALAAARAVLERRSRDLDDDQRLQREARANR